MAESHIEVIARGLAQSGGAILVCRNLKHGHCYLPGGHVEFGESAADALRRELLEEAGIAPAIGPQLAMVELRFTQRAKKRHEYSVVFHVELASSTPPPSLEPEIRFEWVQLGQLEAAKFVPRVMLPWLRAPAAERSSWLSFDDRSGSPNPRG